MLTGYYLDCYFLKIISMPECSKEMQLKEKYSEEEGFEPPLPCGKSVFETDAFGHSATLPRKTILPKGE